MWCWWTMRHLMNFAGKCMEARVRPWRKGLCRTTQFRASSLTTMHTRRPEKRSSTTILSARSSTMIIRKITRRLWKLSDWRTGIRTTSILICVRKTASACWFRQMCIMNWHLKTLILRNWHIPMRWKHRITKRLPNESVRCLKMTVIKAIAAMMLQEIFR